MFDIYYFGFCAGNLSNLQAVNTLNVFNKMTLWSENSDHFIYIQRTLLFFLHIREAVNNNLKLSALPLSCFLPPALCWCIYSLLVQRERKHMAGHMVALLQSCDAIGSHVTVLANGICKIL